MKNNINNFIQKNSPDGGFLQSEEWRKFQESVGRKTYNIFSDDFWANILEHTLPIAGKYFYVPRGPIVEIINSKSQIPNKSQNPKSKIKHGVASLMSLSKKEKAGWIRIEPATEEILGNIKENIKYKIKKAPHDMQPKEIFIIDITKTEDQLLSEMKSKTRYNIRLAEKRGVVESSKYKVLSKDELISEFLRLVKLTAKRDGITSHPENYYRKMIETIPDDILKLYVAEYDGKFIAANLVVFYGQTCTYLHGASDDEHRNVMAPYLLQWQQIQDAKEAGCVKYDFGGINTKTGKGITRFKLGFSPDTKSNESPGSYDIVINPLKYWTYRSIQKIKNFL